MRAYDPIVLIAILAARACGAPFELEPSGPLPPAVRADPDPGTVVYPTPPPVVATVEPVDPLAPVPGWIGPRPTWIGGPGEPPPMCPAGTIAEDLYDYAGAAPQSVCGACSCTWTEKTPDPYKVGYKPGQAFGFVFVQPAQPNCLHIQASGPSVGWNNGYGFGKCSNNLQPPAKITASHVGFENWGYPAVVATPSVEPDTLDPVEPVARVRRCGGGAKSAPSFRSCVEQVGDVACPASYPDRHVSAASFADTRSCSSCECEATVANRAINWHLFASYDCSGPEAGEFITSIAENVNQAFTACNPDAVLVNGPAFSSINAELVMPPPAVVVAPPTLIGGVTSSDTLTTCCKEAPEQGDAGGEGGANVEITITIPAGVDGVQGTAQQPNTTAFGPYPLTISAPAVSQQNPVTVRFFNADIKAHEIHASLPNDGFGHDLTPFAPMTMDPMVREVTAPGTYDFYLHDEGGPFNVGRLVIQP